jgi:phosphoglucosamine mutase
MISASHNPHWDNGIKLFAAGGRKLGDEVEGRLEAELTAITTGSGSTPTAADGAVSGAGATSSPPPGRLSAAPGASGWYVRHLLASLEGRRLSGVRVAVDCANGAASFTAAEVLSGAGADVVAVLADQPDGVNINDGCGSTYPAALQTAVVAHQAHVGLAFDGDADRVIAVDERGALIDGDQLLALLSLDLRERGQLTADTVVVTVMTNLGFRLAMGAHGIRVEETQVGDRYVLEALDQGKWSLGGEQSGHIIFRDLATTGDGILTGLQLLDVLHRTGRPLSEVAGRAMTRLPQVLRNVRVADRDGLASAEAVWKEVAEIEKRLHGQGRVLLRPSGTEPLIRVMVEASSQAEAEAAAGRLVDAVSRSLG